MRNRGTFMKQETKQQCISNYIKMLNVKEWYYLIKRQTLWNWVKKAVSVTWCLNESHVTLNDTNKLKVLRWKMKLYTTHIEIQESRSGHTIIRQDGL